MLCLFYHMFCWWVEHTTCLTLIDNSATVGSWEHQIVIKILKLLQQLLANIIMLVFVDWYHTIPEGERWIWWSWVYLFVGANIKIQKSRTCRCAFKILTSHIFSPSNGCTGLAGMLASSRISQNYMSWKLFTELLLFCMTTYTCMYMYI